MFLNSVRAVPVISQAEIVLWVFGWVTSELAGWVRLGVATDPFGVARIRSALHGSVRRCTDPFGVATGKPGQRDVASANALVAMFAGMDILRILPTRAPPVGPRWRHWSDHAGAAGRPSRWHSFELSGFAGCPADFYAPQTLKLARRWHTEQLDDPLWTLLVKRGHNGRP